MLQRRILSQVQRAPSSLSGLARPSTTLLRQQRHASTGPSPPSPTPAAATMSSAAAQELEQARAQAQARTQAQSSTTSSIKGNINTAERTDRRRHGYFYRDILPPFLRVLAIGSAAYFALHLTWQYMDGREQAQLEAEVRRELEEEVRQRLEVEKRGSKSSSSSKSWFGWGS